jgi:hypothetical protein
LAPGRSTTLTQLSCLSLKIWKPLGASASGITCVTTREGFSSPDTTLGSKVGLRQREERVRQVLSLLMAQ